MSRVRSKIHTYNNSWQFMIQNSGGTPSYTSTTAVSSATDTMTDEVTDGYYSLKKSRNHLPMNPMSQVKKTLEVTWGTTVWEQWYSTRPWHKNQATFPLALYAFKARTGWGYTNVWPAYFGTTPSWPDSGPLLVSALADANAHGWDVGTFLVELHKTIDMVRSLRENVLRRAGRIVSTFKGRKKRFSSLSEAGLAFSQTWLEARYGWRQIAFDLQDVNIALIKLQSLKHEFVRASKKAVASDSRIWKTSAQSSIGNIGRFTSIVEQEATRTVRAGVMLEAIADGLAFVDPLVTAYELTPFSFIADWFANIGDNVAAFSPFATGSLLHAYVTTEDVVLNRCTALPYAISGGAPNYEVSGTLEYLFESKSSTYSRQPATPTFNLDLKINLDTSKLVDLASIFFVKWSGYLRDLQKLTRV